MTSRSGEIFNRQTKARFTNQVTVLFCVKMEQCDRVGEAGSNESNKLDSGSCHKNLSGSLNDGGTGETNSHNGVCPH